MLRTISEILNEDVADEGLASSWLKNTPTTLKLGNADMSTAITGWLKLSSHPRRKFEEHVSGKTMNNMTK